MAGLGAGAELELLTGFGAGAEDDHAPQLSAVEVVGLGAGWVDGVHWAQLDWLVVGFTSLWVAEEVHCSQEDSTTGFGVSLLEVQADHEDEA